MDHPFLHIVSQGWLVLVLTTSSWSSRKSIFYIACRGGFEGDVNLKLFRIPVQFEFQRRV
jgi:hypothetical protein